MFGTPNQLLPSRTTTLCHCLTSYSRLPPALHQRPTDGTKARLARRHSWLEPSRPTREPVLGMEVHQLLQPATSTRLAQSIAGQHIIPKHPAG